MLSKESRAMPSSERFQMRGRRAARGCPGTRRRNSARGCERRRRSTARGSPGTGSWDLRDASRGLMGVVKQ
eukprot:10505670-Alexandrium_andersonii.AAC.1